MPSTKAPLPSITIRISNEEPVLLQEYSELLSSLAKDYAKITKGSTLVISRIEEGSIITTIQDALACAAPHMKDAVAIASAVNSLKGLYTSIAAVLKKAKQPSVAKVSEKGFKSVVQIAKIGVSSRADVDVSYKSPDGSELTAKITHREAKGALENLENAMCNGPINIRTRSPT